MPGTNVELLDDSGMLRSRSSVPSPRAYRPGDEQALVAVWANSHARYGGFVPRSVSHWRWNILDRPGVHPEDIQIVQRPHGTIVGYGVLGPGGHVLEFVIAIEQSPRTREAVASSLGRALENRARARGFQMLRFGLPNTDKAVCRALRRLGYRMEPSGSLQLVIVDVAGMVRAMLHHREPELPAGWGPTFLLFLEPGKYRFCPQRRLHVSIGPPAVVTANPDIDIADCTILTDLSILTEIVFGRKSVNDVVEDGSVIVTPSTRMADAATFLRQIVVRSTWYTPIADGR